jgi:hypothetical protein
VLLRERLDLRPPRARVRRAASVHEHDRRSPAVVYERQVDVTNRDAREVEPHQLPFQRNIHARRLAKLKTTELGRIA